MSAAVVPDAGHFLMLEVPEKFNHLLTTAIRTLTREGTPPARHQEP